MPLFAIIAMCDWKLVVNGNGIGNSYMLIGNRQSNINNQKQTLKAFRDSVSQSFNFGVDSNQLFFIHHHIICNGIIQ